MQLSITRRCLISENSRDADEARTGWTRTKTSEEEVDSIDIFPDCFKIIFFVNKKKCNTSYSTSFSMVY